tara:strand:- start:4761 stop:6203 length:1443 start_codon:yes stop_codon:yes gene_type:complete
VELVDTLDLGSSAARCEGSNPFRPTIGGRKLMVVKELKSETLYKEFLLEIPYQEVDEKVNNKIQQIIPNVSLPGFRKGKAPINIVKKKYESNVLSEVIELIVNEKTKKLVNEKKLKPFRQPKVDLKKYKKNQNVELEIKIDLEPEIELKDFNKLILNEYKINLTKKIIEENYQTFISSQKNYAPITQNRKIKKTDRITINFETKEKNIPDFYKSQKEYPIILDSEHQLLPKINKKLLEKDIKVGDKLDLSIDMSNILNKEKLKEIIFSIEILKIEELQKFKITEDFLKSYGLKNEDELKKNINNNLKLQFEENVKHIQKKELMDKLDSEYKFDLPHGLLTEEFDNIWNRLEHAKKENKLDEDDKNLSNDELKVRYKKICKRRVKLAILLQKIANDNNVLVNEKELTDNMIQYASKYPGQEKQIMEYFKKNPASIESIRGPILEGKVIDLIRSKAEVKINKITTDEYKALEEKTFNVNKGK